MNKKVLEYFINYIETNYKEGSTLFIYTEEYDYRDFYCKDKREFLYYLEQIVFVWFSDCNIIIEHHKQRPKFLNIGAAAAA